MKTIALLASLISLGTILLVMYFVGNDYNNCTSGGCGASHIIYIFSIPFAVPAGLALLYASSIPALPIPKPGEPLATDKISDRVVIMSFSIAALALWGVMFFSVYPAMMFARLVNLVV